MTSNPYGAVIFGAIIGLLVALGGSQGRGQ